MKRGLGFLLVLTLLATLLGGVSAVAEAPAKVSFTDSVGRTVEVPAAIDKVAVSGPHPEAPESWKANAVNGDKMGSNIHLAAGLVNELLSEESVTDSK